MRMAVFLALSALGGCSGHTRGSAAETDAAQATEADAAADPGPDGPGSKEDVGRPGHRRDGSVLAGDGGELPDAEGIPSETDGGLLAEDSGAVRGVCLDETWAAQGANCCWTGWPNGDVRQAATLSIKPGGPDSTGSFDLDVSHGYGAVLIQPWISVSKTRVTWTFKADLYGNAKAPTQIVLEGVSGHFTVEPEDVCDAETPASGKMHVEYSYKIENI